LENRSNLLPFPSTVQHLDFNLLRIAKTPGHKRRPDRAARAYLTVIARQPEAVVQALAS
jgi:hypothetical protein